MDKENNKEIKTARAFDYWPPSESPFTPMLHEWFNENLFFAMKHFMEEEAMMRIHCEEDRFFLRLCGPEFRNYEHIRTNEEKGIIWGEQMEQELSLKELLLDSIDAIFHIDDEDREEEPNMADKFIIELESIIIELKKKTDDMRKRDIIISERLNDV